MFGSYHTLEGHLEMIRILINFTVREVASRHTLIFMKNHLFVIYESMMIKRSMLL